MPPQITCTHGKQSLTLHVGTALPQSFPNDKEGQRNAILAGLTQLPLTEAREQTYLPAADALQLVATVLYPDGIQTQDQYETTVRTTDKACAHAGFGEVETLAPPIVPFSQRGEYRRKYPPIDSEKMRGFFQMAQNLSLRAPVLEMRRSFLLDDGAHLLAGKRWHKLSTGLQTLVEEQVDALATEAGWAVQKQGSVINYVKLVPLDAEAMTLAIHQWLGRQRDPLTIQRRVAVRIGSKAAYGRAYIAEVLSESFHLLLNQLIDGAGYELDGERYRRKPLALGDPEQLAEKLAGFAPVQTKEGAALTLEAISNLLSELTGTAAGDILAEALIARQPLKGLLQQLGYRTTVDYVYEIKGNHMPLGVPILLKEVAIRQEVQQKKFAKKLPIFMPAVAVDETLRQLVYLEMVGPKESVKANWAALVGNKYHYLQGVELRLDGMKQHVKVQTTLPSSGWVQQALIHKQASLETMLPTHSFYLLDDGRQPIPDSFYPMLNRCLAIPILPAWQEQLWQAGREADLIALCQKGRSSGFVAWRITPKPERWQAIVEGGLRNGRFSF